MSQVVVRKFRDLVKAEPGLTLTDYLNKLGNEPGSALAAAEQRKKARRDINIALDGALSDLVTEIAWEEHELLPGQPRSKPPMWANDAIADRRIRAPIVPTPPEPSADSQAPRLANLTTWIVTTTEDSRVQSFLERMMGWIGGSFTEDHAVEIANIIGNQGIELKGLRSVNKKTDKVTELYDQRIIDLNEKHKLEVRLLSQEAPQTTAFRSRAG